MFITNGAPLATWKFTAMTAIVFLNEHSTTSKYEIYLVNPGIAKKMTSTHQKPEGSLERQKVRQDFQVKHERMLKGQRSQQQSSQWPKLEPSERNNAGLQPKE